MSDIESKNAERVREILRLEFETSSKFADKRGDHLESRYLAKLAQGTKDVPAPFLNALFELSEDVGVSEDAEGFVGLQQACGVSWFPENATEYVMQLIAVHSGSKDQRLP